MAENQTSSLLSRRFGGLLILAVTFAVYWPALRGEFLWDDNVLLTENPHVHAANGLTKIWFSSDQPDYLPLTSTSLWLEWRLWKLNPLGYHTTNILLHALSAILLWRILLRLKITGAFLAATIFAVHPVCVASVAWIAERKNTLSMVFFLLSLWCFIRDDSRKSYGISLLAFFLALLSKGSVVMLPAMLLLLAWWQREQITRNNFWRTVPFFALSVVFAAITVWFQFHRSSAEQSIDHLNFAGKTVAASWAIWFYFLKALWPTKLSMIYPQWRIDAASPMAWVPGILLIALLVLFWRFRRSWGRHALFAFGYFVLMLLPVLGFIGMYFLTYSRVADHWAYLALIGVIVGLIGAGNRILNLTLNHNLNPNPGEEIKNKIRIMIKRTTASALVLSVACLTWLRANAFSSPEKLWADTLAKNPNAWAAHSNLGKLFSDHGDFKKAVFHFSEALHLWPNSAETHYNFGNALFGEKNFSGARKEFSEAIRLKPDYPEAHYNLGLVLERLGQREDAMAHYHETVRLRPQHANAHNNLGNLLAQLGRDEEAASHYEKALQLKPNLPEAHNNLANVLQRSGKIEQAVPHYLRAIELKPDYSDAHRNLAIALNALGKQEEATVHLQEALRLNPTITGVKEILEAIENQTNRK